MNPEFRPSTATSASRDKLTDPKNVDGSSVRKTDDDSFTFHALMIHAWLSQLLVRKRRRSKPCPSLVARRLKPTVFVINGSLSLGERSRFKHRWLRGPETDNGANA